MVEDVGFPVQEDNFPRPDLNRFPSEFSQSSQTYSVEEVKQVYFGSSDVNDVGCYSIVSENNVSKTLIRDMIAFWDSNADGRFDSAEKQLFTYQVTVFISTENSYLQKAWQACEPKDGEACLFLEDNSTDFFSDRSTYVKLGSLFTDELKKSQIAEIEGKQNAAYSIFDYSANEIKELINTGKIENPTRNTMYTIYKFFNLQTVLLAPVFTGLGDVLLLITEKIRYIKFDESSWNPDAKIQNEKGEWVANTDFSPILLPFKKEVLEEMASAAETYSAKAIALLEKQLEKQKKESDKAFAKLSKIKSSVDFTGLDAFIGFMKTCASIHQFFVEKIIELAADIIPVLSQVGLKWINIVNAFYCGLWNSLIEAVLGFVDFIAYIFKAAGMVGDAVATIEEWAPQALEFIDETIQSFTSIDFKGIISGVFDELVIQLKSINLSGLVAEVNLEQVAYFIGGIIGFAVQVIASIYYSGGIEGVVAAFQNLGKMGKNFITYIKSIVEKLVGISTGFSLEGMVKVLQTILETLKGGVQKIRELIVSLIEGIKRGFKTVEEFAKAIMEYLKISYQEFQEVESLGMKFTALYDDLVTMCLNV